AAVGRFPRAVRRRLRTRWWPIFGSWAGRFGRMRRLPHSATCPKPKPSFLMFHLGSFCRFAVTGCPRFIAGNYAGINTVWAYSKSIGHSANRYRSKRRRLEKRARYTSAAHLRKWPMGSARSGKENIPINPLYFLHNRVYLTTQGLRRENTPGGPIAMCLMDL